MFPPLQVSMFMTIYNFISIYQRTDFLMLNQIWNVGLPSFWILCIQIWVSAFSLCPYLYHFCFLFSSMVCYSFSLQELHQSIGRQHRSLHMLHCSRRSLENFVRCNLAHMECICFFPDKKSFPPTTTTYDKKSQSTKSDRFRAYIKEDAPKGGPLKSSRFLCCVLLALSWNTTNENPITDKLSRAIN